MWSNFGATGTGKCISGICKPSGPTAYSMAMSEPCCWFSVTLRDYILQSVSECDKINCGGWSSVKIACFHFRGHGFDPFSRNWNPTCSAVQPKKKKKESLWALWLRETLPRLSKRAPCAQSEVLFNLVPPTTTPTHKTCQHEFFCFPWNCFYQILSV